MPQLFAGEVKEEAIRTNVNSIQLVFRLTQTEVDVIVHGSIRAGVVVAVVTVAAAVVVASNKACVQAGEHVAEGERLQCYQH
jgi:hypothetical protein